MARTTRQLLTAFLAGVILAAPLAVRSETRVEGFYEAEISAEKNDHKWRFGPPGDNGMPGHYAELSFWNRPTDKFEIFARIKAKSNRDDDRTTTVDYYTPPWFSGEGHLKLRQNKYEAYLFYRQNRFFINDEPLLRLVDDNQLKNDDWGPKAQGIRLDAWEGEILGIKNLGATVIISDNGGTFQSTEPVRDENGDIIYVELPDGSQGPPLTNPIDIANGDDNKIFRARHNVWDRRIESAVMYLRKDWTDTSRDDWRSLQNLMYNDVFSFDVAFSPRGFTETGLRLGPIDLEQSRWTTEMAWSRRPYQEEVFGDSQYHARALAFEVRDIHIGDLTVHSWYNDFGENFRDFMSSRFDSGHEYNRIETNVEGIYLVPLKSVTTKVAYNSQHKRVADEPGGGLRPAETWYAEVFMEFINGFRSRFAYRNWHGFDSDPAVIDFATYPDWFGEISVENFLAKVRLQARIHDAGTWRQVTIYGFDMSVNLTDKLKGYLRALNVNEETEARHTIFAQLKYDIGWGAEIYFEYGDAGQSDNLAYNGWFIDPNNGDNLKDRFKLLVKAWF